MSVWGFELWRFKKKIGIRLYSIKRNIALKTESSAKNLEIQIKDYETNNKNNLEAA